MPPMNDETNMNLRGDFIGKCVIVALGVLIVLGGTFKVGHPMWYAVPIFFAPAWLFLSFIFCFILQAIVNILGGGRR